MSKITNNHNSQEHILWQKIYNNGTWETYHEFPTANAIAFYHYHLIPYAKKLASQNRGNIKLLDVGCGSGSNAIYFASKGFQVSGIDCSQIAVKKTLDRANIVGQIVNIEVSDFKSLPYANNSFDFVFSDGVFYYGDELQFVNSIKESYRVLRKKGVIRVYTKTNKDFMAIKSNEVSSNTYLVKKGYEKGMKVFCAPKELVLDIFQIFNDVKLGIEEFNYVGLDSRKSFWVITATK